MEHGGAKACFLALLALPIHSVFRLHVAAVKRAFSCSKWCDCLVHTPCLPPPPCCSGSWLSEDPADVGFKYCCLCSSAGVVRPAGAACAMHTADLAAALPGAAQEREGSCATWPSARLQPCPSARSLQILVSIPATSLSQGNTGSLVMCSSCQLSGFCTGWVPWGWTPAFLGGVGSHLSTPARSLFMLSLWGLPCNSAVQQC